MTTKIAAGIVLLLALAKFTFDMTGIGEPVKLTPAQIQRMIKE